jgi:hypothetical protein
MFGKFSLIRDEDSPRVALLSPAPIVVFDTLHELEEWIKELTEMVLNISAGDFKIVTETPLQQAYALQVIEEWQNLLQKTIKDNPGAEK